MNTLTRDQLARHIDRSLSLHAQGYRITFYAGGQFTVCTPEGKEYTVDLERHTCDCVSFTSGQRRPCKHLSGGPQLLCDTLDEMAQQVRNLRAALNVRAERRAA